MSAEGRREGGQATVELAALLPVALIVAVIAVNALSFFSECASFDRLSRQAVRTCATSMAYGQDTAEARALVKQALSESFALDNEEVEVAVENAGSECVRYRATLSWSPTLFGMGLKSEVFGVGLPSLKHEASYAIDPYNPGVIG